MDNVTHTLFGLVLTRTGIGRNTPKRTLAMLISANLPDLDVIAWFWGDLNYLKHHRGFSHSLAGLFCEAALVAMVLRIAQRARSQAMPPETFRALFLVSLTGLGSHALLDYTNSYGIRPFLPFDARWLAADLVFIVDPWLLAILAAALFLPLLFRLMYQEIGAKRGSYRASAWATLGLIVVFWMSKWVVHERALEELRQRSYQTGEPVRVGALPQFLNPLGWSGVVETDKAYHLTFAGLGLLQSEFERRRVKAYFKPDQSEILVRATQTPTAGVFLDFARYPLFQISSSAEGHQVTARDLRFDFASRSGPRFVFSVLLDQNLRVVSEQFRF